jgi:hypothetical protein
MSDVLKGVSSGDVQKEVINDSSAAFSLIQTPDAVLSNSLLCNLPEVSNVSSSLTPSHDNQPLNKKCSPEFVNNESNWNNYSSVRRVNNVKCPTSKSKHNLSEKKMPKKLPILRLFSAFKRRRRVLRRGNGDLAKRQLGQLYEFMDQELSKHNVSEFRLRSGDKTKITNKPSQKTNFIKKCLEEDSLLQEQPLELNLLNTESLESKLTVNQDKGGAVTPPSNNISREAMRRRIEESPLNKEMVEVPDYVYNSDDDLLINLLEHSQYQS